MADNLDPEKFLRERGVTPRGADVPPPPPTVTPDRQDVSQSWYNFAGRGLTKGIAGLAANAAKYGVYATPLGGIGPEISEAISTHPYYQDVKAYSEEPDESNWETGGRIAGEALGTSVLPGLGVGGAVTKWGTTLGQLAGRSMIRGARTAGRVASGAVKGAEGGLLADPEHPGQAAAGGALAGIVPTPVGRAIASPIAKRLGGTAIPIGAAVAVEAAVQRGLIPASLGHGAAAGLGWHATRYAMHHLIHSNIRWHSSPVGGALFRSGSSIMDAGGKIVGSIPPGLMGFFAGPTVGQGGMESLDYFGGFSQPGSEPTPNPAIERPPSIVRKPPEEVDPTKGAQRKPFSFREDEDEKPRPQKP